MASTEQGNQSVGVQRQYTGSAGKATNCQLYTLAALHLHGEEA
jgi:SRSO17 transposase